ncbi:MAG: YkgJ family cysteine cluster protein [Trichlorobacter sp.]|uniref:YkgJ family cysteine cluster protein n=1 Tax=Trichlorobacter sp. TaxID=2911007 RepID=UPI002560D305|nr:YkgJ family cysteine cluster protein [Trichlorobacter sp.]MDK9718034.1 YkgJ family cysteine cluster protein [Trichlorobacter sp.]
MADTVIQLHQVESRLYRLAVDLLATVHDTSGFAATMSAFTDLAENLAGHRPVACKLGCSHCCVLNVSVLLPEAVAIAGWLSMHCVGTACAAQLKRLQRHALHVRWMEDSERIHRQTVCPFVDARGGCSIYPVRPLVCRAVTSLNKEDCLAALDPSQFDADHAVSMDTTRKVIMDTAFCTLARAMKQQPMMSRSIELCNGVTAFLANPGLAAVLASGADLPVSLWD